MRKKTIISLCIAVTLGAVTALKLSPHLSSKIHHSLYKYTVKFSPELADKIIGKPIARFIIRYVDERVLHSKLSNVHPWVKNIIHRDFAKYTKFSVKDVQDTFDFSLPEDNLTIFTVKDGKITRQNKFPKINEACKYALDLYEGVLKYLINKGYISNVSFILRLSDVTFTDFSGRATQDFAPCLAVTKDTTKAIDQDAILIPDWMNLEGWSPVQQKIDKTAPLYPWEKKVNAIFWRGGPADISGYRHAIVALSKKLNFEKIDAQFTYGSLATATFIEPHEHIKYKFQLTMDGHTAAWQRPVWQLYSGCVMLKQASKLVQWYYDEIQPDVHYIEVSNNPEDLLHIFDRYSDVDLKRISENAHNFAKENLSIEDMLAHIILVLQQYEKLQHSDKTPVKN